MSDKATVGAAVKEQTQKVLTPAIAWINPMRRMSDGSAVAGCYNLVAAQDLTLKAGDTLFVAQVKGKDGGYNGSLVVKKHTPRTPKA
jgi:hypothetical protein